MSRRAMWAPQAANGRVGATDAAAGPASSAPPTARPTASGATLPARSALDAHVGFARLAALLSEVAGVVQELAHNQLEEARETRLLSSVDTKPTSRLLTAEDLAARLQVDARTIRRWHKAGKIPRGIEIANAVVRWREDEVERWLGGGGAP